MKTGVYPIGVHIDEARSQAEHAVHRRQALRLRSDLSGRRLIISVDRLDYSKGLVNRISAFDQMWTAHPQLARAVSLLQIATPSRGTIEAYGKLQADVSRLCLSIVSKNCWIRRAR